MEALNKDQDIPSIVSILIKLFGEQPVIVLAVFVIFGIFAWSLISRLSQIIDAFSYHKNLKNKEIKEALENNSLSILERKVIEEQQITNQFKRIMGLRLPPVTRQEAFRLKELSQGEITLLTIKQAQNYLTIKEGKLFVSLDIVDKLTKWFFLFFGMIFLFAGIGSIIIVGFYIIKTPIEKIIATINYLQPSHWVYLWGFLFWYFGCFILAVGFLKVAQNIYSAEKIQDKIPMLYSSAPNTLGHESTIPTVEISQNIISIANSETHST